MHRVLALASSRDGATDAALELTVELRSSLESHRHEKSSQSTQRSSSRRSPQNNQRRLRHSTQDSISTSQAIDSPASGDHRGPNAGSESRDIVDYHASSRA